MYSLTVPRYVYTNNAGEEHEKEVLIGETDQLWPIVRHWYAETHTHIHTHPHSSTHIHTHPLAHLRMQIPHSTQRTHILHRHIADTIKYVIENFNEFVRTNKAAEMKNKPKEVLSRMPCVFALTVP